MILIFSGYAVLSISLGFDVRREIIRVDEGLLREPKIDDRETRSHVTSRSMVSFVLHNAEGSGSTLVS